MLAALSTLDIRELTGVSPTPVDSPLESVRGSVISGEITHHWPHPLAHPGCQACVRVNPAGLMAGMADLSALPACLASLLVLGGL